MKQPPLPDHSTIHISPRLRPQRQRRRGRPVVALSVIGMIAGFIWIVVSWPARQPVYRGKALEVWLRTYGPRSRYQPSWPEWKETDEAVRQMGTNCIPTLVRMIRAKDSKLKLALGALAQKQHVIKVEFVPAADRNIEASRAFVALGGAGSDAVPLLMDAFEKDVTQQSRYAIADALAWIGPGAKAAVPLLLQAATNSDTRLRANALWALGDIHSQPDLCVPLLVRALGDLNGRARLSAAHALGRFGPDAWPAIQPLSEMAKPGGEPSKVFARKLTHGVQRSDFRGVGSKEGAGKDWAGDRKCAGLGCASGAREVRGERAEVRRVRQVFSVQFSELKG